MRTSRERRGSGRRSFLRLLTGAGRHRRPRRARHSRWSATSSDSGTRPVIWVDLGPLADFPLNETRRLDFRQSAAATVGRHHRAHRRLRPLSRQERQGRGSVPGARGQLCPLGLPGDVVPAVGIVHVPVPRRRLLRRTASTPPARRRAACSTVVWRVKDGKLQIQAPHYPDAARHAHRQSLTREKDIRSMPGWLKQIGNWFDARLGVRAVLLPMMRHPVPRAARRADGLVVRLRQRVADVSADPDSSPASAWRWSTSRRPTRRTRACSISTTSSRWAGSCGRCTTTPARAWS